MFSLPGSWLADRVGRRAGIMVGWLIYAAVHIAMPFVLNLYTVCVLLFSYGIHLIWSFPGLARSEGGVPYRRFIGGRGVVALDRLSLGCQGTRRP